ncbi:MAG: 4'-phosphopantetheinyl transferase family protein [Propionicimonas sp.]
MSVVWASTSPGTIATGTTGAELGEQDRARAASFGPDRRRAFLLGRSLVAGLVRELLPDASGWSVGTRACRRCGARHAGVEITGVPVVASVSYAPGLVVAAAARGPRVSRLGIDVERDAANATRSRDLQRLLGPSTVSPLRRWTRIESVLKADGRGLRADPADVHFRAGRGRVSGDPARYRVVDVAGPAGYVISLAWCGAESLAAGSGPATG